MSFNPQVPGLLLSAGPCATTLVTHRPVKLGLRALCVCVCVCVGVCERETGNQVLSLDVLNLRCLLAIQSK